MERNEQYEEFEGLAVSLGAKCFEKWRGSLSRRGIELADAVQEAKLALIELAPRLEDPQYGPEQRRAFIVKSIRGRLSNWAKQQSRDGDHRDRPDPPEPDADGLLDLKAALAELDETTRTMTLAKYGGKSYAEIAAAFGLSEGQVRSRVRKAIAQLTRRMHAGKDS